MKPNKVFWPWGIILLLIIYIFFGITDLSCAQEYFQRGIFGLDNPSNFNTNDHEIQLIYGTYANYLFGVVNDEPSVMIFCRDTTEGAIKMNLERDPRGHSYHVHGTPPPGTIHYDYYTTQFWPYISRSFAADIQISEIDTFVNNVHRTYGSDVRGLGTLLVSHQGYTSQSDHWRFIDSTCKKIQLQFGNAVKSAVIDDIDRIPNKVQFFNSIPYLDVFQNDYYPIYTTIMGDNVDYIGTEIQTCLNNLVRRYDSLMVATKGMTVQWQALIQSCEQQIYNPPGFGYFRRPTETELYCQAFLAISRGAKGIHYYAYFSNVDSTGFPPSPPHPGTEFLGLITNVRDPFEPFYTQAATLDSQLATVGTEIMSLAIDNAFNCDNIPAGIYIQNIEGDTAEAGTPTIEIGLFTSSVYPSFDYFILVNRRCSRDNNGTPAYPQTITMQTNKTGQYQIRDLYSGELFVTSNGYFRNITIDPGRGRVFELRQMFGSNETWDTDTINVSSNITVPSGKTLTISPNSTIKFYNATELKVQGTLTANGTSAQHIEFGSASTNPTKGIWKQIKFDNSQNTSILVSCQYNIIG